MCTLSRNDDRRPSGTFEGCFSPPALQFVTPELAPASTVPPSHLDGFLPEGLSSAEVRRGRLLVSFAILAIAGYAVALLPLGWLGWSKSFAGVGAAALVNLVALGGLRTRAWALGTTAWVVFPLLIVTVFGVALADMGLGAPELMWLATVPIIAALTRSKLLATVCAILIASGAVALAVWGTLHPFPATAPEFTRTIVAMVSLAGVAVTGAIIGQIYERSVGAALVEQRQSLDDLADALRQSENRYRLALENVPVGVVQTTADGRFLLANRAIAALLGYDSVEDLSASGRSAAEFYASPEAREALVRALHSDGAVRRFQTSWKDRHGNPLQVRIDARGTFGAGGSLLGIEGIVEDISAEHEVRERLRTSEARFRALVQQSSDVVLVADVESRVTYVSPSVQQVMGYTTEQVQGRSIFSFVHPDDLADSQSVFQGVQASGSMVPATEFRLRHAEGHYLFAEGVGTPLFDDPAIQGLVINFRDITDRKRAEAVLVHAKEQAEEVAHLKSTFLANMSHEIRTPLTGILGFADILADEVTDPQQREFVELIEQSGKRLMDTLNSVLDLARLDAGQMDFTTEPVPLAEAARQTAQLLAPLAQKKGLTLQAIVQDENASADLDRSALDRILTNLVGNALKFTESGGVQIVVRSSESSVSLDVVDTGVGISEEFLPRLFEEFQQESSGAQRSHEGSGLGLSITRQLTERLDGTLSVQSTLGQGSTFSVTFPSRLSEAEPLAAARQPRVLIVDDNAQTLRMAQRMVEASYRVDTATNAADAEALAQTAAEQYDAYSALLLDINLGTMDTGEDLMRRLRQRPPYHERPILAFTAYALHGDRERFLASGFSGYFSKPFTRNTLLEALAEATGHEPEAEPPAPRFIVRNRDASPMPKFAPVSAPEPAPGGTLRFRD